MTPLIELTGIGRTYGTGALATPVLRDVTLGIAAGEFVAIVGASGSGKSTLMNILGLLDRPSSGTYRLAGQDVAMLGRDARARLRRDLIGFVFQQYNLIPGLTLVENVALPAVHAGAPRAAREARAAALLARLGLGPQAARRPAELSGGQQQRASIARALVNGGALILADEPTGALDRRNGAEVMALLSDLADAGHTVILITHDRGIARAADRIIEIEDGGVIADTGPAARGREAPAVSTAGGGHARLAGALAEAARAALTALATKPARTLLTLLGIVVGVASVVAMLAIGRGTQVAMWENEAAIGTDWLLLGTMGESDAARMPLTVADAEAIAEVPNVAASMPALWDTATFRRGAVDVVGEVIGTTEAYRVVHQWDAARGAFFTAEDVAAGAPVLLLGQTLADRLFPDLADPSGEFLLVNNMPFLVAGVLEAKGVSDEGEDRDARAVMPLRAAADRLFGKDELTIIVASLADMNRLAETGAAIRALMTERHGREDFWIYDAAAAFQRANEGRVTMNLLLAAIAGISLLVGGIGIMNIMLMSVQERRREIGIRTATGATSGDVLRQFVVEALVLSGLGALIGLAAGIAIGVGAALLFGMTVIFSIRAALLAVLAALVMGLVFGFAPALRAARLDPVAALAD